MDESDDKTSIVFELKVPKFMDTSLINIDLQPTYVRCDVKGKVTQMRFTEEILVEQSKVQRSQTTGCLVITCPKANITKIEAQNMRLKKLKEDKEKEKKLKELADKQKEAKEQLKKEELRQYKEQTGDFIIKEASKENQNNNKPEFVPDFDPDEVPPLE